MSASPPPLSPSPSLSIAVPPTSSDSGDASAASPSSFLRTDSSSVLLDTGLPTEPDSPLTAAVYGPSHIPELLEKIQRLRSERFQLLAENAILRGQQTSQTLLMSFSLIDNLKKEKEDYRKKLSMAKDKLKELNIDIPELVDGSEDEKAAPVNAEESKAAEAEMAQQKPDNQQTQNQQENGEPKAAAAAADDDSDEPDEERDAEDIMSKPEQTNGKAAQIAAPTTPAPVKTVPASASAAFAHSDSGVPPSLSSPSKPSHSVHLSSSTSAIKPSNRLVFQEDSPVYRQQINSMRVQVAQMFSRLDTLAEKATHFSKACIAFSEAGQTLATELSRPWLDSEVLEQQEDLLFEPFEVHRTRLEKVQQEKELEKQRQFTMAILGHLAQTNQLAQETVQALFNQPADGNGSAAVPPSLHRQNSSSTAGSSPSHRSASAHSHSHGPSQAHAKTAPVAQPLPHSHSRTAAPPAPSQSQSQSAAPSQSSDPLATAKSKLSGFASSIIKMALEAPVNPARKKAQQEMEAKRSGKPSKQPESDKAAPVPPSPAPVAAPAQSSPPRPQSSSVPLSAPLVSPSTLANLPQLSLLVSPTPPSPRRVGPAVPQAPDEDIVTMGAAMGKLAQMVSTMSTVSGNLGLFLEHLLVTAVTSLGDRYRTLCKRTMSVMDEMVHRYEAALDERIAMKKQDREKMFNMKNIFGKKKVLDEEYMRLCALRREMELRRFDHVHLLNEICTHRRIELIEVIAASFLAFVTFFHEGDFVAQDLKIDIDYLMESINKRKVYYEKHTKSALHARSRLAKSALPINQPKVFLNSPMHALSVDPKSPVMASYLRMPHHNPKIKEWKRRWCVLENGSFFYLRDKAFLAPRHVVNVLTCAARPHLKSTRDWVFELISPVKTLLYQAESEYEMQCWIKAFANSTEYLLSQQQTRSDTDKLEKALNVRSIQQQKQIKQGLLAQLRRSNPVCADCGTKAPDWCSINLGVQICIVCSGIHRSLGTDISKVRSIVLDDLDTEVLDLLVGLGNTKINSLYEGKLPPQFDKPAAAAHREQKENFIQDKYVHKTFINRELYPLTAEDGQSEEEALGKLAWKAIESDDALQCLYAIAMGLNVNWRNPSEANYTLLMHAAKNDSALCLELLIQNNANWDDAIELSEIDEAGVEKKTALNALEIAKQLDSKACIARLSHAIPGQKHESHAAADTEPTPASPSH